MAEERGFGMSKFADPLIFGEGSPRRRRLTSALTQRTPERSAKRMPDREDDFLTPATRLLEKKREMIEVEQALNAQKEGKPIFYFPSRQENILYE